MIAIVSVIPSEYAACPFPSNSSLLLTTLAHAHDWWSYRQLRALQTNRTEGQFGHRPIYQPIISLSFTSPSPIQISSEHYFEWREVESPLPIVAIRIIIHPSFAFASLTSLERISRTSPSFIFFGTTAPVI